MSYSRAFRIAPIFVCCLWLAAGAALAQAPTPAGNDNIELIMSPRDSGPHPRLRNFLSTIRQRIHAVTGFALPFTKCEKWSVPRSNLEAVKKEAARRGVVVTELGANWNRIMHAADTELTPGQKALVELAKAAKATTGVRLMAAPPPAVLEYALTKDAKAPGKEPMKISVALSDNAVKTIVRTSVDIQPDMAVWRGTVEENGALVTLMWWPNGRMAGTVQEPDRLYSIRHLGGRVYAMVEMKQDRMPHEHAPMPAHLRSNDPNVRDDPLIKQGDASLLRPATLGMRVPSPASGQKRLQDLTVAATPVAPGAPQVVIDVIIAYTKKAAANYSDIKRELIDLSIEEGNESFRVSGLGNVKLRLAHAYQTDYVEEGAHFDHVWRFADKDDGYMEEIHALRDRYKADVAVLVVDDPAGCGLATRVFADADEAFAVVHHDCAALTYSVAHEIGHLIGARHEPAIDKMMTPFPYGHGYVNGNKWRDIMSYRESCDGCPRIPVWSSPLIKIKGEPAGTAEQDNARVIAEQAARVAAFR
jgi:hypothetical protein